MIPTYGGSQNPLFKKYFTDDFFKKIEKTEKKKDFTKEVNFFFKGLENS